MEVKSPCENLQRSVIENESMEFAISLGKQFKLISPWLRWSLTRGPSWWFKKSQRNSCQNMPIRWFFPLIITWSTANILVVYNHASKETLGEVKTQPKIATLICHFLAIAGKKLLKSFFFSNNENWMPNSIYV